MGYAPLANRTKQWATQSPMPYLGVISCYDIVRDDLRFQDLLRKMKLPVDLGR